MPEKLKLSKKEYIRRETLVDESREIAVTTDLDLCGLLEDYYKEPLDLEKLVINALNTIDLQISYELERLREYIKKDIEERLESLIRYHRHTKDGKACREI